MDKMIEEFEEYLLEEEKSANTIATYVKAVEIFFSQFSEITKKNMIEFKKSQIEKYSPKTAANRCIAMNRYCEFAKKPECKTKSIKIHKATTVENVITKEQCEKMLSGLKADENEKGYWMIKFLAKTGARVSEFVRMDKKCLQSGVCEMWTKGKIRRILVPDSLIAESRDYFTKVEGDLLFPSKYGGQMTTRGVAGQIQKWAKKYGIPAEVAHPHSFRHLFAIEFLKQNGNIALLSDLLGHESVDTTAIYLRLSAEEQKEQFNKAVSW